MALFRHRVIEPELLDHAEPEEARRNLADLVRINQRFGGYSTAGRLVSSVAREDEEFTLLDMGAASGDTGRYLKRRFPGARIVSLDNNEVNAAAALKPKLIADAFELPFERDSFDFVFSSLLLHHFTNEKVIQLLRSFAIVARKAVLVTDLERHPIPFLFLPVTKPILRWSRITVLDGCTSVRAAFTERELIQLAESAGLKNFSVEAHRPAFRLSLLARK